MQFDRFDILAAYNMFSMMYGSDRVCDRYINGITGRLARISYRPGASEEYLEGLSENAREIYDALVEKHSK